MAIDYERLVRTAYQMLRNNGRLVTVRHMHTTPADPAKPWEGVDYTDPDEPPYTDYLDVPAASVPPSSAEHLGIRVTDADMWKRVSEILIVAPGPSPGADHAFAQFVLDEGATLRVVFVEKLRPASRTLLYFMGVSR